MPAARDPLALKRVEAGTYRSGDARFTVEQAGSGWMVTDEEQHDELGLPLVRGPFATLDAARAAIEAARSGPAPTSDLTARKPATSARSGRGRAASEGSSPTRTGRHMRTTSPSPREPELAPIDIRRYRHGDGDAMRALWATAGLRSIGDDDDGLDLLAERNPGLVLLATEGDDVVGTALGAWDGRRGWIYHVATAPEQRRTGLGRRLVHEIERKLRALGCQKVNVVVRDGNDDGAAFWSALGYSPAPARQLGKEL